MKVHIQKTKASQERRAELAGKINRLLEEYNDVPILVAQKLKFFDSKDEVLLDFVQPGQRKNLVHILRFNTFLTGEKNE
jgi:hypothetical protein